ncbi:MAG: hypothetical protein KKH52_04225, partial [Nanoarchaeota archaeon]|nr:hypothetical protein [Nanoarchaeota archaeon]
MLQQISQEIKDILTNFSDEDKLIFNNNIIEISKNNFAGITSNDEDKTIAFIDGGQAEIISAGNFCLSLIRVAAVIFKCNKKISNYRNEFYLFTRAKYIHDDLYYESKIFPITEKIIEEEDLLISSNDASIKTGMERAPISKVCNMARRFAELALAGQVEADFVILDGTLEKTFNNEEKYLSK